MSKLRPIHFSMRPRLVRIPHNMTKLHGMSGEDADRLERIATSIFCDCVNVGTPFGRALLAIYLSGLNHGFELSKEIQDV